jgi:hypothetical protein
MAVLALAIVTIGCGGGKDERAAVDGGTTTKESGGPVPEGVAAQYRTIEEEVRAEGGETTVGPWRIAYIVEPAEPWFERRRGRFVWRPVAPGETHHIEILPIEAESGRVVPDVPLELEVLDERGAVVDRKRLAFYYAEFFHYAENFSVPEPAEYTLRASIGAPAFRRHGEEQDAPALAEDATATFRGVRLETGE